VTDDNRAYPLPASLVSHNLRVGCGYGTKGGDHPLGLVPRKSSHPVGLKPGARLYVLTPRRCETSQTGYSHFGRNKPCMVCNALRDKRRKKVLHVAGEQGRLLCESTRAEYPLVEGRLKSGPTPEIGVRLAPRGLRRTLARIGRRNTDGKMESSPEDPSRNVTTDSNPDSRTLPSGRRGHEEGG
jgi:hypothetical protein